jgi:Bacterial Ig-like domain
MLAMLVLAPSALAATSYHINRAPDQALVPLPAGAPTLIGAGEDDVYTVVDLPFSVYAYGNAYTQISPSSNGTVVYGPTGSAQYVIRDNTNFPGPTLLAFGADLTTPRGGLGVRGEVAGVVGSRTYTVEWNVDVYPDFTTLPERARLQAVFHENSHRVDTYYSGTTSTSGWIGMKLTPQDFTRFGGSAISYPSAGTHLVFTILSIETPGSPSNDNTPTVTGSGDNAAGAGDITVEIFDGDAATGTPLQTQTVSYDSTTGAYATDPFTTLADGTYTIAARQTDDAQQITTTVTPLVIDTVAPNTTITSGPQDPANRTTATFEFSSNEAGTFECALDEEAFAACASPKDYGALAEGNHALAVRAIDRAGNVDPTPDSFTWVVDTTGPLTTIDTGPAEGSTTADSTPTFAFSSDEAGSTFACSIDGDAASACEAPFTSTALIDGEHTFSVTATDAVGNEGSSPATRTFTVDTSAPDTAIDAGPAEGSTTADSTPMFKFSADELGSVFECSIDGGEAFSCESPYTLGELSDDEHSLSVTASDDAGNTDLTAAERTFVVDTGDPQTTIDLGPAEGSTTGDSTPTFEFSSDELGSVFECSIDGGEGFSCDSPYKMDPLADGEHSLSVTAIDSPGNRDGSPPLRTFTVDTTAPQTAIGAGPSEGSTTADSTPTFRFSSGDLDATFECSIDDGEPLSCEPPYTTSGLSDGEHTFSVTAIDRVGNRDRSPVIRRFTVDTRPAPDPAPTPAPGVTTLAPVPATLTPPATPAAERIPCVSKRRFHIRLRPARLHLVFAIVRVNHKRVAIRRSGGRLRATVNLRGLRKGVYPVTIDARDVKRRHHYETRRYRTC